MMFPFTKKKEEEPEIIEEDLPSKKKFRDLKPESRKQRKEPVKPWGKGERILVLVVLGITVGLSAILGAIAKGGITFPDFSFSSPKISGESLSLGQTFVYTKNTNSDCCEKPILDFKNLTDDLTGDYGFYVIRLDGSNEYGVNETDSFKAASLIKLPTAVAVYKQSEEGLLDLDARYTLKESDKMEGNGTVNNYQAGTSFTFRQLMGYMINQSDNTAFNIFEIYLGDRKIQETIKALDMTRTSIYDNLTSAKDTAQLIKKIKDAEILNRTDSNEILSYMRDSEFNDWIVAGVPEGTIVEHKHGRLGGVVNDAGIVYGPNPYILVIVSTGVDELEANQVIPKISKEIYDFEATR